MLTGEADRTTPNRAANLLDVLRLYVKYGPVSVLQDVSFRIKKGEVVGLTGESGSGKSTLAQAVMGLLPRDAIVAQGSALFQGEELLKCSESKWRAIRGARIAMIFQDPAAALHPQLTVGQQIRDALLAKSIRDGVQAAIKAKQLLEEVHFPAPSEIYKAYPHQLSGGQRQRVVVARALAGEPSLLIADEPTSSLDTTTQSKILSLIKEAVAKRALSVLFITHDPALLSNFAQRLLILHKGTVVEDGSLASVCQRPVHPYTSLLMSSVWPEIRGRGSRYE